MLPSDLVLLRVTGGEPCGDTEKYVGLSGVRKGSRSRCIVVLG